MGYVGNPWLHATTWSNPLWPMEVSGDKTTQKNCWFHYLRFHVVFYPLHSYDLSTHKSHLLHFPQDLVAYVQTQTVLKRHFRITISANHLLNFESFKKHDFL